jgi:hypothetical protein
MALPQTLVESREKGKLIPFVGAGVSMAVTTVDGKRAYPSWKGLLELAAERLIAEQRREHANIVTAMLAQTQPDYMETAKYARQGLDSLWSKFLRDAFEHERERIADDSLELARAIWGIGSKLIITTNYDNVLRWSCPAPENLKKWDIEAADQLLDVIRGDLRGPAIWHLHGSVDDTTKIILAPDGYTHLYPSGRKPPQYKAALEVLRNLMTTHHLLFVGFSLDDEFLKRQLEWVRDTFKKLGGPHYVVVREQERAAMVAKLKGLDIQPITFSGFGEPLISLLWELGGRERPTKIPSRKLHLARVLDRVKIWTALRESCERPEHTSFLLHGTRQQGLDFFLARIRERFSSPRAKRHKIVSVSSDSGFGRAKVPEDWGRHLRQELAAVHLRIDDALAYAAEFESLLIILGHGNGPLRSKSGPNDKIGLDEQERAGLAEFIANYLPNAVERARPRNEIRILVPVELAADAPQQDPLLGIVEDALQRAQGIRHVPHDPLSMPDWSDIEDSITAEYELDGRKPNPAALAACRRIYEGRPNWSFVDLAGALAEQIDLDLDGGRT